MQKYRQVPMSFADAMHRAYAEILAKPLVLTTEPDFASTAATAGNASAEGMNSRSRSRKR
jgi:predicted nucleic acid-binding protein